MAVEYFSKWSEAKAVKSITSWQIIDFVWGNIISRFGVPRTLISDNGTHFDCKKYENFTRNLRINHRFASVAHPQTNGQTEVTNRTILTGLRNRLNGAKVG